jgi:hypothetical protein
MYGRGRVHTSSNPRDDDLVCSTRDKQRSSVTQRTRSAHGTGLRTLGAGAVRAGLARHVCAARRQRRGAWPGGQGCVRFREPAAAAPHLRFGATGAARPLRPLQARCAHKRAGCADLLVAVREGGLLAGRRCAQRCAHLLALPAKRLPAKRLAADVPRGCTDVLLATTPVTAVTEMAEPTDVPSASDVSALRGDGARARVPAAPKVFSAGDYVLTSELVQVCACAARPAGWRSRTPHLASLETRAAKRHPCHLGERPLL